MKSQAWMDDAACSGMPQFADLPARFAVPVCQDCPVKIACLDAALTVESEQDLFHIAMAPVYGGMPGRARAALIKRQRDRAASWVAS